MIQDVLVEGADHSTPIANQPVGWLATTVTLFDALKKDIEKGYLSLYQSVGKVKIRFPDSKLHQDIAKTVCVLQILGNLPISIQNVTSLMHGGIADPSAADQVKKAVEELISAQLRAATTLLRVSTADDRQEGAAEGSAAALASENEKPEAREVW